jgi:hypothetical protein
MNAALKTLIAGPEGVSPPGSEIDLDANEIEALVSIDLAGNMQ